MLYPVPQKWVRTSILKFIVETGDGRTDTLQSGFRRYSRRKKPMDLIFFLCVRQHQRHLSLVHMIEWKPTNLLQLFLSDFFVLIRLMYLFQWYFPPPPQFTALIMTSANLYGTLKIDRFRSQKKENIYHCSTCDFSSSILLCIRGCIQKFPDCFHDINNNSSNKHSLRSNRNDYGGKTH